MSINTDYLKSFLTLHETGSFTKASEKLFLSQSALSQKMARLEDQLETSLFIRSAQGLKLTSSGEKLLVYAKQQLSFEEEFLNEFQSNSHELAGSIRLATYSSILSSLVIPKLSPWLRKNAKAQIEFISLEVIDLVPALKSNKADLVILDYFSHLPGVEEIQIGEEEFVIIESTKMKDIPSLYLDHGPHDNATESFFKFQNHSKKIERAFMGDVHGILEAVALGLGRAVMSKHLVEKDPRFKIVKSKKKYIRPIVMNFYKQNYYSKIHRQIINELEISR
jgi:DNA-binding transcriptional LysR family regulator